MPKADVMWHPMGKLVRRGNCSKAKVERWVGCVCPYALHESGVDVRFVLEQKNRTESWYTTPADQILRRKKSIDTSIGN